MRTIRLKKYDIYFNFDFSIRIEKARNHYAAISMKDQRKVLVEGRTMKELIEKADETGEGYIISPILDKDVTYF